LDSRGIPTVEGALMLDNGSIVVSAVPGGTSTGDYEAKELRDNDPNRFQGKGVLRAVENVNKKIAPALVGKDPSKLLELDQEMIGLDGKKDKSNLGANAILDVSQLVTKAGAVANGKSLYQWIYTLSQSFGIKRSLRLPTPLFNMINGGLHGSGNLDFQEFHIIPASSKSYNDGLRSGAEIYMSVGENLKKKGAIHSVGDEGGYAPNLFTNSDAFEIYVESIKSAGYALGRDVFLGLDVAANSFYQDGVYSIRDSTTPLDDTKLLEYYQNLNNQYNLAILEDAFFEDGWESWKNLTASMGNQVIIVGDDLLATNPERVKKAIKENACNAILVKPNQIGTISETLGVIKLAIDASWRIIVSHRSGETNDSFIADFAVGVGADYAKFGAPARGERVAKYNRLSTIYKELETS